ncbi:Crp/Fnr family transcriptional regulator [Prosthecomicrobium sp. N25]|uniref:Crp/Fnr family transcriptional regulator n=1 Tax=Prosthecomicrobium sp. N25 TaxID=3129254 RepID=UPI0030775DC4
MSGRIRNRLLAALEAETFEAIRPDLEPTDLPLDMILLQPREPIRWVYFLESGLSSDVAMVSEERGVECGLAGFDGLAGIPVLLGMDRGIHTSVMQVGGTGHRMAAGRLRVAMDAHPDLRRVLLAYVHIFLTQSAQSAACNARHSVEQRLARWLLMSSDRTADPEVPLTHAYLSLMLGIRRAGVTVAIHVLEGEGLIRSMRGRTTIRDRAGLERRSCSCYRLVRDEQLRVFAAHPVEAEP